MEGSKACMEPRQEFKLCDVTSGLGKGMKCWQEPSLRMVERKALGYLRLESWRAVFWAWARIPVNFSLKDWKIKRRRFEVRRAVSIPLVHEGAAVKTVHVSDVQPHYNNSVRYYIFADVGYSFRKESTNI